MERKVLGLYDIEDLLWLASEQVWHLFMKRHFIDDEGNFVGFQEDKIEEYKSEYVAPAFHCLDFKNCDELRKLSLLEVEELSVEEIKSRYLHDILPIARRSFREDHILLTGMVAGAEISDDYLDAIFCLAWKNDLKIWCIKWHEKDIA